MKNENKGLVVIENADENTLSYREWRNENQELVVIENADENTLGHRGWGSETRGSRGGVVN